MGMATAAAAGSDLITRAASNPAGDVNAVCCAGQGRTYRRRRRRRQQQQQRATRFAAARERKRAVWLWCRVPSCRMQERETSRANARPVSGSHPFQNRPAGCLSFCLIA